MTVGIESLIRSHTMNKKYQVTFSVIGLEHNHIYQMTKRMIAAGAKLKSVFSNNTAEINQFLMLYPKCYQCDINEILSDKEVGLVLSAARPDQRAAIGIDCMLNEKDFLCAKPGILTLEDLKRVKQVQFKTKRFYSICYSERFWSGATLKAGELVAQGEIGAVVATTGLGPHCIDIAKRPDWFFQKKYSGGIINDLACHQIDQFIFFTGAENVSIIHSQVANKSHYHHSNFEDLGELILSANGVLGTIRVDWLSPKALGVWGDSRLMIQGTKGYIELRKTIDLNGKPGGEHLFLVNHNGVQYYDCDVDQNEFFDAFFNDVLNRLETSMTQKHCFYVTQLAITSQMIANQNKS